MKRAWRRIGTPDAISWVVIFLVSVQQISGSLTAPFADITGRVPEFLGLRILSLLAMFAVLGIGKLLLLRFARERPLPWLTLIIFALTPAMCILLINWLLIITDFTEEWTIGRRLIVAVPGIFTILILSALLTSYARELAKRNLELAETARELDRSRSSSSARIEARKQELISAVRNQLERSLGSTSDSTKQPASEHLKSLIDDVVRPMSYELSRVVNATPLTPIHVANPSISWSSVLSVSLRANPAHPVAATLWIGALVGMFLITGFGLIGVVATATFCTLSFAILWLTRVLWRWMHSSVSTAARAVIFSLALLVLPILSAPTMQVMTGYDFLVLHAYVGWMILSFFMTWTVTLIFGVNESLRSTYEQLVLIVDSLKRESILLNSELRAIQTGVARLLHGPIQEAVSASLHRITSSSDAQDDDRLVGDLQRRIQELLLTLNHPPERITHLQKRFEELIELWDEVVEITIDASQDTLVSIEADHLASAAVLELVREACNNAIRHGEAQHVNVALSLHPNTNEISLSIENDGKPLADEVKSGLGSLIFDERCLSWTRVQHGHLVRVHARIPLQRDLDPVTP